MAEEHPVTFTPGWIISKIRSHDRWVRSPFGGRAILRELSPIIVRIDKELQAPRLPLRAH